MTTSWRTDEALPDLARGVLGRFCEGLGGALGERLQAIVLYGSVAKGDEFHAPITRIETLVVLKENVDVAALDAIAPVLRTSQREARVTLMIMTAGDLRSSTDVFPSKFLDMKKHHRLLQGADPFEGVEVSDQHLRLQCEQELKNLMLRFRTTYVRHAENPRRLMTDLADAGAALVDALRSLLVLRKGEAPLKRAEVVDRVVELGVDPRLLEELLAIGRGRYEPRGDELTQLIDRVLVAVGKAAELADSHEEAEK